MRACTKSVSAVQFFDKHIFHCDGSAHQNTEKNVDTKVTLSKKHSALRVVFKAVTHCRQQVLKSAPLV